MTFGNPKRGETAYCAVTYLWSFTRAELGLPDDATNEELEIAAEKRMNEILEEIYERTELCHNDCEISVG